MTVGTTGLGYACIDLIVPKLRKPSLRRCPGAMVKVSDWELVGVVLRVTGKLSFDFDDPMDGIAFVGPISGYVGMFRESKTNPLCVKFPGTREAEWFGFGKKFFDAVWALYCKDTDVEHKVGKKTDEELFTSGIAFTKLRTIHPISIFPTCRHLYGFQWALGIKERKTEYEPPKGVGSAIAELGKKGIAVKPSFRKVLRPALGFGITAGWRAWCVVGRKKGSVKDVVTSFVHGIPDRFKPFKKFYYCGKFIDSK